VRGLLVVCLLAWFFSPPDVRYAIPIWVPFLLAVGLEVEFVIGGRIRAARRVPRPRGRAPQPVDLERFGWPDEPPDEEHPSFWNSPPVPRRASSGLRRLAASVLVVAFVALVAWGVSIRRGWSSLDRSTQTQVEHVLSQQAARIAGHAARVRCDSAGRHVGAVQEADGVAQVGGSDAWLTPAICFRLYRLIDHHDSGSFSPTGRALAVLAHESWHLHGVADEGVANCYAFQSGVTIGVRFGLSPSLARAMMREQLADNPSDSASDPRYLVPAGCSNGGRYDLDRHSSRFP
jgi:hypothetical protein